MSIIYCEKHSIRWDSDRKEGCPECLNEPEFIRELRYTVIKHKDSLMALNKEERATLRELEGRVQNYRMNLGRLPLICVVGESDWPEYEPTWKAIEERMEQESKDNGQFGVGA